jgi:N-acetylglutamate synthase-like GNAT family acetyltransferase
LRNHGRFSLREATAGDQEAITRLIRAVRINPLSLRWSRFLVAVDGDGRVVGCGQIKPHRDGSVELASIAVERAWRRQGIATAVIERLMQDHPGQLWLTCLDKMVPFYRPFGFDQVLDSAVMPPYFRRSLRAARLLKRLSRRPETLAVMTRLSQ